MSTILDVRVSDLTLSISGSYSRCFAHLEKVEIIMQRLKNHRIWSALLLITISSLLNMTQAATEASNDKQPFGTVTDVLYGKFITTNDNHTLKIEIDGVDRDIKLAFLRIPIKGEPFFEEAQLIIESFFKANTWVQVSLTGQRFYNGVAAAFINTQNHVNLNAILLKQGLAIPDSSADDQKTVLMLAEQAKKEKKGLWGDDDAMHTILRHKPEKGMKDFAASFHEAQLAMDSYVGVDVENRRYFHGRCYALLRASGFKLIVFTDTDKLDMWGYRKMPNCDASVPNK
jgi:endonuclease YncB( thermonuclease family)